MVYFQRFEPTREDRHHRGYCRLKPSHRQLIVLHRWSFVALEFYSPLVLQTTILIHQTSSSSLLPAVGCKVIWLIPLNLGSKSLNVRYPIFAESSSEA